MPYIDPIYLHAATRSDPSTTPWETGEADDGFAALAAAAVAERPKHPIAGLYHVATREPSAPDAADLAGAVLRAANLPHAGDTSTMTIANRTNGFFDALWETTKTLRELPAFDPTPVYVTTGDAGPLDITADEQPSSTAGAALTFSRQVGCLELAALCTYRVNAIEALMRAGGPQSHVSVAAARQLKFLATSAVAQAADHGTNTRHWSSPPSVRDVDFIVTPFPPDTLAHHVLLAALGARSLVGTTEPDANASTAYGSPLFLVEELAKLVAILNDPAVMERPHVTILVVSGTEGAQLNAAVFQTPRY